MFQNQSLRYQTELMNTKKMLDKVQELGIDVSDQKERLDLMMLQLKRTTCQEKDFEKKDTKNFYIVYQIQLELLEKYHNYFRKNNTQPNYQPYVNKKSETLSNYEKQSPNLEDSKYTFKKEVEHLKNCNRKQLKRMIQKSTILTGYFTALTTLGVGGIFLAKHTATHKEYYTLEETYNVNKDTITNQNYYAKSLKETIKRIEYDTWDSPNLFDPRYKRKIEIYDVGDLDYENLKEYALLDMASLNIEPESSYEKKFNLTDIDLYEEPIVEIKKITQDQRKYNFTFDIPLFALILWAELEVTKIIYCYHINKNYINNIPKRTPINDLKQEYHELIYYRKKLELEKKRTSLLVTYLEKAEHSKQKNSTTSEENLKYNPLSKKKELLRF